MRIVICDDDPVFTEQLQKYLRSFFKQEHLKCPDMIAFTDGKELLADKGEKDILFLDVEMPDMNGLYVGAEMRNKYPNLIIFMVTSYMEYLDAAMDFHMFRYLSKPLDKQRLFRGMCSAVERYHSITYKIPVETRQGVFSLDASAVITVEGTGRKVIVHTADRDYESVYPMQYWQEILPANRFFRSHRSFIVNLDCVASFDQSMIYMEDRRFNAYLTKRKYSEFKKVYFLYLKNAR